MVFSSTLFLFYFLPAFLMLYYVLPKTFRNYVLVVASLIFYSWGEPIFVGVMIFSTIIDYSVGRLIEYRPSNKKLFLLISIVCNLSLLCIFKYSDFLILNLNKLFSCNISLINLPLPIGISFYTFQTMSYSIDVYRGKIPAQKSFLNFLLYTTLFPQLIAGPIVRYNDVISQIDERNITFDTFSYGMQRFVLGLGKKVLLANRLGSMADKIFDSSVSYSSLTCWFGAFVFALQIYYDFAGYSDMAIGLGKMIGFDFPENFNNPYISCSVSEFWRRWHMTLGSWFRDYVYFPLGGSRVGTTRLVFNLLVVWSLTGLWHGAAWGYVLWGLWMFVFIALEKIVIKPASKYNAFRNLITIIILVVGWVFFKCETMSFSVAFLKSMFNFSVLNDGMLSEYIGNSLFVIVFGVFFAMPVDEWYAVIKKKLNRDKLVDLLEGLFLLIVFALCVISLVNDSYNPFLYFRF